jgi:hypothetical protein
VNAVIAAGYPYELLGIFYYLMFLMMGRKRFAGNYSNRSRYLAVLAAMAMVGCVPFHYAGTVAGTTAMLCLALFALVSTAADAIVKRRGRPGT